MEVQRPTTQKRREEVFQTYSNLLKKKYAEDPGLARCLSKSYLYREVGLVCGYTPHFVGRIVQTRLHKEGLSKKAEASKKRRTAVSKNTSRSEEIMDEEIRFILDL